MSILKTLKLTAAKPANPSASGYSFRDKPLHYLREQKALAEAQLSGTEFTATRKVTRKNEAGEKVRVEVPRHVRKGWFFDADGKLFFQLRYANRPIELAKGMNAIEVKGLEDLPTQIAVLIDAVLSGELDSTLMSAVADRKANFAKRVPSRKP